MKHAGKILRHIKALEAALQDQTAMEQGVYPVVLYFGNDADRAEFIEIVKQAKPGLIAHPLNRDAGILETGKDVTKEMAPEIERICEEASKRTRYHRLSVGSNGAGEEASK